MSDAPLPPHLDPRGRHRGGGSGLSSGLHAARPIARVLGSILSISLLVLAGYLWYTFRAVDNGVPRLNLAVNAAPTGGTTYHVDGKDLNILVVGNDDRQSMTDAEVKELHIARDGGSLATDTMMIVHIPADGSKATL
ncbi:MAG: LytR family transcriptional regulator, partial [Jatrophihabitans sp.]